MLTLNQIISCKSIFPFAEYNPLMENVVEREYSTPKLASGIVEDITEPSFVPPSYGNNFL